MTLGAIPSNGLPISLLSQPGDVSQTQNGSSCGTAGQSSGAQGGGLLDAVSLALQQIGASGQTGSSSSSSSDSSDSASPQDPAQALASFMHNLMAALHAQSASANGAGNDGEGAQGGGKVSGVSHGGGHHHSHMKADLDSLMQQVSPSGSGSASDASSTNGSDGATTDLEQSFQNLMSSLGQSGSTANLSQFLKALSGNVQGMGPAGNMVSTKA